jgi:hypothetical protein
MTHKCPVDLVYYEIEPLMAELFYKGRLSRDAAGKLKKALLEYWKTECDAWPKCPAAACYFMSPGEGWVGELGYSSLRHLLDHYDFAGGIKPIQKLWSVDVLKADWARRPGHIHN